MDSALGSGNAEVTVFIVDDDPSVCTAISMLLTAQGIHTETYANAKSFLTNGSLTNGSLTNDSLTNNSGGLAGCLLLDVRMPGLSGLSLQKAANKHGIGIPIILMTGYADVAMATEALRTGAFDFIEKPFNSQLLLERVSAALEFDGQHREQRKRYQETAERIKLLSRREREVMKLVVTGNRNKDIGELLNITMPTVEAHRKKVMQKLNVKTVSDLVRLSIIYDSNKQ